MLRLPVCLQGHRLVSKKRDTLTAERSTGQYRNVRNDRLQHDGKAHAAPRLRYWAAWSFFSLKKTSGQERFIANYTQPAISTLHDAERSQTGPSLSHTHTHTHTWVT